MNEIKDWDHFVKLANEHSIIALTAYHIHQVGLTDLVPIEAMQLLDNGRMQSMIQSTWLVQRWKEVNKILSEAVIKQNIFLYLYFLLRILRYVNYVI